MDPTNGGNVGPCQRILDAGVTGFFVTTQKTPIPVRNWTISGKSAGTSVNYGDSIGIINNNSTFPTTHITTYGPNVAVVQPDPTTLWTITSSSGIPNGTAVTFGDRFTLTLTRDNFTLGMYVNTAEQTTNPAMCGIFVAVNVVDRIPGLNIWTFNS